MYISDHFGSKECPPCRQIHMKVLSPAEARLLAQTQNCESVVESNKNAERFSDSLGIPIEVNPIKFKVGYGESILCGEDVGAFVRWVLITVTPA